MKTKSFSHSGYLSLTQLALSAVLILVSFTAYSTPVLWQINSILFNDGGTGSGSFIYDEDSDSFSSVSISTTLGTTITTAKTYTSLARHTVNPPGPADFIALVSYTGVLPEPGDRRLALIFNAPITNAVGVIRCLPAS